MKCDHTKSAHRDAQSRRNAAGRNLEMGENWTACHRKQLSLLIIIIFCFPVFCNSDAFRQPDYSERYVFFQILSPGQSPVLGGVDGSAETRKDRLLKMRPNDPSIIRTESLTRYRRLLQYLGPTERFEDSHLIPEDRNDSEDVVPADETDPLLSTEPGYPEIPAQQSRKRIFPGVAIVFLLLGLGMFGFACYVSEGHILHADNKTMCWLIMGSGFEVCSFGHSLASSTLRSSGRFRAGPCASRDLAGRGAVCCQQPDLHHPSRLHAPPGFPVRISRPLTQRGLSSALQPFVRRAPRVGWIVWTGCSFFRLFVVGSEDTHSARHRAAIGLARSRLDSFPPPPPPTPPPPQTRTACCPGPDDDDAGGDDGDGRRLSVTAGYAAAWEPNDEHETLCML